MTLEEAIEELGTLFVPRDGEQDRLADAQEMAIRSLEAWEKVKAEIEKEHDNIIRDEYSMRQNDYCDGFQFAMKQAFKIIDKHLQEVTTDADSD